jgi:hypothetical protein
MFRLSRTRFQVLMEDMKAPQSKQAKLLHVDNQVYIEAQLLLPVKTLAYGVPLHTFMDYFQMQKACRL